MSFKNLISFEEISESSSNFLDIDSRPNWEELFGNRNPLNLEVGFGVGNFIIEMGLREPSENFIGIDFYHKGIRKVITRIAKYEICNARIVYGDAKEKIPLLFNAEELDRVYILFPDPWPKKRHHKRRLINKRFLALLSKSLINKGIINISTDWEDYAQQIELTFKESNQFKEIKSESRNLKTKFEKRGIKLGHKIFNYSYQLT